MWREFDASLSHHNPLLINDNPARDLDLGFFVSMGGYGLSLSSTGDIAIEVVRCISNVSPRTQLQFSR